MIFINGIAVVFGSQSSAVMQVILAVAITLAVNYSPVLFNQIVMSEAKLNPVAGVIQANTTVELSSRTMFQQLAALLGGQPPQPNIAITAAALKNASNQSSLTRTKDSGTKNANATSTGTSTKAQPAIPPAILKEAKAFAVANGLPPNAMQNFEKALVITLKENPSLVAIAGIISGNKQPSDGTKGKETGSSAVGVGAGTMPSSTMQVPLQIPEALTNALNTIPSLPPGVAGVANLSSLPANFNPANAAAAFAAFQEFLRTHNLPPLPPGPPPPGPPPGPPPPP